MSEQPEGSGGLRVGLLTPSGWGNLGDAAIQDATIHAIRRRHPDARIHGFTLNPHDTRARHGIEAEALSGFSLVPGYRVQLNGAAPADTGRVVTASSMDLAGPVESSVVAGIEQSSSGSEPSAAGSAVSSGVAAGPSLLRRGIDTADEWLYRGLCDARYLRRMRVRMEDFDLVLASGGGQVDDEWGGAWGHPWTLAKWATLTRANAVPFRILSVGLCHLDALTSRLFARMALRQADYVSFRDETSSRRAQEMGLLEGAPVVPDLAFSHPALDPEDWIQGDREHVAVGPMVWKDPQRWARRDARAHEDYLQRLAEFVRRLLGTGRKVTLLPGDDADSTTASALRERVGEDLSGSLEIPRVETVEDLLDALRGVGIVMASRLHLVLLAAALGKPVLPLSYDTKVDSLAADLGLADYRCDIASAGPDELSASFQRLDSDHDQVRAGLLRRVTGFRERLERQYDEVLR